MKKFLAFLLSALLMTGTASVWGDSLLLKTEYNYQDGLNLSLDLDGDGKDDEIFVKEEEKARKKSVINVRVNDKEYKKDIGSCWIRDVYICTLSTADTLKEIVIVYGYHSRSWCSILRYENNELKALNIKADNKEITDVTAANDYADENGVYSPQLTVSGDGTLYLSGFSETSEENVTDKYQEVEKDFLVQFEGEMLNVHSIGKSDVLYKKLYAEKMKEICNEYVSGKRTLPDYIEIDPTNQNDSVLYFSLQDFNFDGIPELYHTVCNRFESEYSSVLDTPEIYYIKNGKVEQGSIVGSCNLLPGYGGRKIDNTDLSSYVWHNVVKNTETGEINFIAYNGFSAFVDFPQVNCDKLFFDPETGSLYSENIINQPSQSYEQRQILNGYEYIGTDVYFNSAVQSEWDIWKWQPVYIAPKVTVNEKTVEFDRPPVIVNDRTLVPIRKIAEALGAEVQWDEAENKALIFTDSGNVELRINDKNYKVKGMTKVMDVPARLMSGRTYVPARAVAEAFGCTVDWDEASNTVIIKK